MLAIELNFKTLHITKKWCKEEKMEKKFRFQSENEFLNWTGHEKITLEIEGSRGWELILEKGQTLRIESDFYNIMATQPYGAFKATGHLVEIGDEKVSGIVEFGFDGKGEIAVINRRRCVISDSEKNLVAIIEVAPDRLNEPVAVVISPNEFKKLSQFSAKEWLNLFEKCLDGIELMAARELMRAAT